jgi:hypothetical protein
MPTRPALTPAIQSSICSYIRAGGYAYLAAEASGVPRPVFRGWMRRGRARRAARKYRDFYEAVRQAVAQARLTAEMRAFEHRPLDWLRCGPGRQTARAPGWTSAPRPRPASGQTAPLQHPEVVGLIADVLRLLEPFPEARVAVAVALQEC